MPRASKFSWPALRIRKSIHQANQAKLFSMDNMSSRGLSHDCYKHYKLKRFSSKPCTKLDKNHRRQFSKCCNACGKDICGFSYHCEEDKLDLHPYCRKLEDKIVFKHTIFGLVTESSSKCVKCGKRKIENSDVQDWSYVSQCKTYRLHVYCMTDMIQEAYEDLTLKKSDSRELVRYNEKGKGKNTFVTCAKWVIKILFSTLLGDITLLISNSIVEFLFLSLQL
ncbi:uncharacterized protein LOC111384625 isoform X3 [Olea europaea var. sylvestris]|uniref:uncharacterized protein LOC111384625 isoform X3 n=1 Tax=Olea europaea var. sylvestris TaxID=158386 RepID=UPI000C1D36F3|nr:uncharacterized protein LOC111384625 isoform X3 [Olea europaea var. sylvestris]